MPSIIFMLIIFGAIAALMSVAFRNATDPHRYRPEPRGTIDHAAHKALGSD